MKARRAALTAAAGVAVVVSVLGAIVGVKASQFAAIGEAFANQVPPAERVNAVAVERQEWESHVTSVGSVVAVQGTEVSVEADGVVRSIRFAAGSLVHEGDVLVALDDEVEQSQLRAAEAAAELARVNLERARRLLDRQAISQADFDTLDATYKQSAAQVDNIRAVIAKKVVRAPFTGKIGIRRISVGDYLVKGAPVASLQTVDPVFVEFSVPQRRLAELGEGLAVAATTDAHPGRTFHGEITAVEPHVDTSTRNLRVQATFSNAHGALKPGMFVTVDVALRQKAAVNVIPATAIVHAPHGASVFVIEPATGEVGHELVLREQPVTLGERRGDFVAVEGGPEAGQQVVATGVFKLRTGMPVVIDNTLAPDFALAPSPGNG